MDLGTFPPLLMTFFAFISCSFFLVFLFQSFGLSPAVAYLVSGIVLGPECFNIISSPHEVRPIGELGVFLLLFAVGLELPLHRLHALRHYVFGLGGLQVLVTSAFFTLALWHIQGMPFSGALLIAVMLSFSSTALVIQMLSEKSELSTRAGRAAFSVLLFQDLVVVVVLILSHLTSSPTGSLSCWKIIAQLGQGFMVLMSMALLGRWVVAPLFSFLTSLRYGDVFLLSTAFILLGFCLCTQLFQMSAELGAFLAGLSLAETAHRHHIESELRTLRTLLLGFFFMTIGLEIRLSYFQNLHNVILLSTCLAGILGTKTCVMWVLGRAFRLDIISSFRLSLWLCGCGEFVFVLLTQPEVHHFLKPDHVSFLYTLTVASMIITPLLNFIGLFTSERARRLTSPLSQTPYDAEKAPHVIIVGFGRVGQTIARIFDRNLISYVAIDLDAERVRRCREQRFPVIYSDGRKAETLAKVGLAQAKVLIITVDNPVTSFDIIDVAQEYPNVQICARVRDHDHATQLAAAGVMMAIPEVVESGLQLASLALQSLGYPMESLEKILKFEKSSI